MCSFVRKSLIMRDNGTSLRMWTRCHCLTHITCEFVSQVWNMPARPYRSIPNIHGFSLWRYEYFIFTTGIAWKIRRRFMETLATAQSFKVYTSQFFTKSLQKFTEYRYDIKHILYSCENGSFLTPYWYHQSLGYLKKIWMTVLNIQWCPWTLKGPNI